MPDLVTRNPLTGGASKVTGREAVITSAVTVVGEVPGTQ
jgi:hypothetical protein